MREMRMRPMGLPVWPRSAAAKRFARRRAERMTTALDTCGATAAAPCVPGAGAGVPSSLCAPFCHCSKVCPSCELISCCS